jgi:Ni,Fe-hydrogenase III small subunit/ferredoxin
MLNILKKIIQYPRLTVDYPRKPLKAEFMIGRPVIDAAHCTGCGECVKRCPSAAIELDEARKNIGINIDQCIFCALCEEVCPAKAVTITHEFELAARDRHDLHKGVFVIEERDIPSEDYEVIGSKMEEGLREKLGRSLQIREVDAGSCNGCDYEINAMNNPLNDLERFGVHFVASPRHADMLLVTGTACRNMELALIKTYNATSDPKLVVAVGACACSGGIFRESIQTRAGIDSIVPVDVYIPGCPPRPQAIIYGILKAVDRL